MQQKIVITGGPGTGKSTVIEALVNRNFTCMREISRQVTLDARKQGIAHLFLSDPLLFSRLLLEGRIQQFKDASELKTEIVFFDRGIPDVHAYMNFLKTTYPSTYIENSQNHLYSTVFLMPPWKEIYVSDAVRYESYEESLELYNYIKEVYLDLNYDIIEVPFGSVEERTNFIVESLLIK